MHNKEKHVNTIYKASWDIAIRERVARNVNVEVVSPEFYEYTNLNRRDFDKSDSQVDVRCVGTSAPSSIGVMNSLMHRNISGQTLNIESVLFALTWYYFGLKALSGLLEFPESGLFPPQRLDHVG